MSEEKTRYIHNDVCQNLLSENLISHKKIFIYLIKQDIRIYVHYLQTAGPNGLTFVAGTQGYPGGNIS